MGNLIIIYLWSSKCAWKDFEKRNIWSGRASIMQDNSHLNVTHKAVSVVDVCVFRAQFGQSRSFNSLSHKNLIMNMEPLVPALPSTNEYEETATDNGRILLTLHTHTH